MRNLRKMDLAKVVAQYYPRHIHPFDKEYDESEEHKLLGKTVLDADQRMRQRYINLLSQIRNTFNLFVQDISLIHWLDRSYTFFVKPTMLESFAYTFHISLVIPAYLCYKHTPKEITDQESLESTFISCMDFTASQITESVTTQHITNIIENYFDADCFPYELTCDMVMGYGFNYIENINLFQAFFTDDFNTRIM